ncbi:MFS transporter [Rhodococcus sp. 5G237]
MSVGVQPSSRAQARRAVISSQIGTTIEWYDFNIFGLASALVFGTLFFPEMGAVGGTLLAMSTFGVAFIIRPIGAVVFAHYGDRIGRKAVLVTTLMIMGVATVGIGLLPTYDSIGILAPVLLVICRMAQGFSLGGEQTGAWLVSLEHSKTENRGVSGGWVNTGVGLGLLLANVAFLVFSQLPGDAFMDWGWRVPFLLSAVLLGVGLFIRIRLDETPEFKETKNSGRVAKAPIFQVFKESPKQVLLIALAITVSGNAMYILAVYFLSYAPDALDISRSTALALLLLTSPIMIFGVVVFGRLSDRLQARRVFQGGCIGMLIAPFIWFALLNTGSIVLMAVGFVLYLIPYTMLSGSMPGYFSYCFPPETRFSGMAIGANVGTIIGPAFAPLIASALYAATGEWYPIALYMAATALVALVAAAYLRPVAETKSVAVENPAVPVDR